MTQSDIIQRFSDLSAGFSIDERVTLDDFLGFLRAAEDKVLEWAYGTTDDAPISAILPDELPLGDQIGLDYLQFIPETDDMARQLFFGISWQDASWEVVPGVLTITGFALDFVIVGRNVTVAIVGFARLEELELTLSMDLPSLLLRAELKNSTATPPSPVSLLDRFANFPGPEGSSVASVQLQDFTLLANPLAKSVFFNLQLANLQIGPVNMAGQVQANYSSGAIAGFCWADFLFTVKGQDYLIALYAEHPGPNAGWLLEGGLAIEDGLKLKDLLDHLGIMFSLTSGGDSLSDELGFDTDVALKFIYLSVDTQTHQYIFMVDLQMHDPFTANLKLTIDLTKQAAGNYDKYFSGQLTLGQGDNQRTFNLIFDQQSQPAPAAPTGGGSPVPTGTGGTPAPSATSNTLIALYQKPDGDTIQIGDLVSTVIDDPTLVGELNNLTFTLKNALLVFEHDSGATPANKYLFAVDVDFGIDLSGLGNLPIIGQQLAGKGPLKLAFQPIVDSGFTDLSAVKALLPNGSPAIPDTLSGRFALATTITFGDFNKVINLGMSSDDKKAIDSGLENTPPATANGSAAPTDTAPTQSTDVNKNFGALSISRLNLAYEAGTIKLGLDGALKVGPLELALFGLGASYKIQGSEFSAHLDGLMLDFEKPPLTITGGFFKIDRAPNPPDYVGELNLQMEDFGLLVLGAFSQMADGHPSMFLYVFVDVPLGGPVFFFVEGLAFGFGYNRRLEAPPIDKMYNFPLVADAIGASPQPASAATASTPAQKADLLRQKFELLADYIYPEEGQYFLAVGLKFNSFKILNCFALLTVGFGEQLDFALMGIARVTTPPEEPEPTVNIELAFSVRYNPAEGLIAANGILTPNTFVYSPLVRLEGGFAYYAWMKGEHEGDFVATIGGYHPAFQVPAHYPSPAIVPRLTLKWAFSDYITIKGEAYFALTPKAMMAGGRLVASFDSNPDKNKTASPDDTTDDQDNKSALDIEATFTAGVDFLIYWEPFHYEADAFVEIYAKASLDTFLGTFSATLSARADLDIWGPEFAGTAKVTAKVLGFKVHFTMDFGDTVQQQPQKVGWDTFAHKFLPANFAQNALNLVIQGGLVKTIKASERTGGEAGDVSGDLWIVNPKDLVLIVSSLFPIADSAAGIYANPVAGPDPQRDLRGKIIAQKPAGITSNLEYTTTLDGAANSSFQFTPVNKNFPESLWTKNGGYATAQPGINGDQVINAKGGYRITPLTPPKALATHSFHVSNLSYEEPPGPLPLNLFPPQSLQYLPLAEADAQAVDPRDAAAAVKRSDLLNSMLFDAVRDVQLKTSMFDMFTERPEVFTYAAG